MVHKNGPLWNFQITSIKYWPILLNFCLENLQRASNVHICSLWVLIKQCTSLCSRRHSRNGSAWRWWHKNICMSLSVMAFRNWWKNSRQVVEEELIRETFKRTTKATSDWGLVWHTAGCYWWLEMMEIWACVHIKGQHFEHFAISDVASPLVTFSC